MTNLLIDSIKVNDKNEFEIVGEPTWELRTFLAMIQPIKKSYEYSPTDFPESTLLALYVSKYVYLRDMNYKAAATQMLEAYKIQCPEGNPFNADFIKLPVSKTEYDSVFEDAYRDRDFTYAKSFLIRFEAACDFWQQMDWVIRRFIKERLETSGKECKALMEKTAELEKTVRRLELELAIERKRQRR